MVKAFYDKANPTRNLITTIAGIGVLVFQILVSFGVLTPEQSLKLGEYLTSLSGAIQTIVAIVTSVILMFKATDA